MELFSAITVSFNESKRFSDCLNSVSLVDQLLVFDMGSTDGSIEIAKRFTSQVRHIPRVEVVEKVWPRLISETRNDWIILLDPDEIFPSEIFPQLQQIIQTQPEVGLISIPWKYYFLGKPLTSTSWGQEHFKARIFHRDRVDLTGVLFKGIQVKSGVSQYTFSADCGFVLKHYWADSISQLFSKHWRYIRNDGEARYKNGQRFNFRNLINDTFKTLRKDLFEFNGIKDGFRGIFLSIFHAWFIFNCYISLCLYQFFKVHKLNRPKVA